MDFSWTREQEDFREGAVKFAEKRLGGAVIEADKKSAFPKKRWKDCAEFGIQGIFIPKLYGGLGLDFLSGVSIMEGLGYGCRDNGFLLSLNAHIWGCEFPVLNFGTESQKKKYLPRLCSGGLIGAHAMTEPGAGSDAFSLKTLYEKKKNSYVLNGVKAFVTNGPVADVIIVYAKSAPDNKISCFIADRNNPGILAGGNIEKMGLRTSPLGELAFQDCVIPEQNILGKEGDGNTIFNFSMETERAFIFSSQIGAMERQLNECVKYAKSRKQFGRKILDFEAVSGMLADMKIRLETSRLLIYKLAWLKDRGGKSFIDASIAKLYISECLVKNSLSALRVMGGYGYTAEYGAERELRDSIGTLLYSGTSEIQRNIIAEFLK